MLRFKVEMLSQPAALIVVSRYRPGFLRTRFPHTNESHVAIDCTSELGCATVKSTTTKLSQPDALANMA